MPPSLTYQPLVPEPAGATPAADAALRALVRALARQAAAEIWTPPETPGDAAGIVIRSVVSEMEDTADVIRPTRLLGRAGAPA